MPHDSTRYFHPGKTIEVDGTESLRRHRSVASTAKIERWAAGFRSIAQKKPWWRLSEDEEKDLLNKEFEVGDVKFRAGDIKDLADQVEVPAGPREHHPELNQLLHTSLVYDRARELSDDPMVILAAILHDLGKTETNRDEFPSQHRHESLGVPMVERVVRDLGLGKDYEDFAKLVAEYHLTCHRAADLTPKALRRFFARFKQDREKFESFVTTCEADHLGRHGVREPYASKELLQSKWDEFSVPLPPTASSTLAIGGRELMQELGLKPGPQLGQILTHLRDLVLEHPELNTPEHLMGVAKNKLYG